MVTLWRFRPPTGCHRPHGYGPAPVREDGTQVGVRRARTRPGRAGEEAGGRMAATVMLVEDERKLRDLVRSYLERAGFTVLSTGSGAEAIMMASSAAPDLIVLDLGLPDVPGE